MTGPNINKYSLSVVSGGRLELPRSSKTTHSISKCSNNHNGYLSKDCKHYIVPFNNMLKVYSLETRQCVKTFKYLNNSTLQHIFDTDNSGDLEIVHIDFESTLEDDKPRDEHLILYTNKFHKINIKYRGKLEYSEPLQVQDLLENIGIEADLKDARLIKVFQDELLLIETKESLKVVKQSNLNDILQNFPLETILKYTWSNNEQYLCVVTQLESDFVKKSKKKLKNKHLNGQLKKITTLNLHSLNQVMEYTISNTTQSHSVNATIISSLAVNNESDQVAIGFASGVINLLTLSNGEAPSTRLMKWHIDSVLSLAFDHSDQYLISGGWEKVLSFWSLKNSNTQQFLPRLNGVVVNVSGLIIPGIHSNSQDGLISVTLQQTDNETMSDYQIVVINSSDLQSKLSCNGPFAVFENNSLYEKPISAINSGAWIKSKPSNNHTTQVSRKHKDVTIKPFVIQPGVKNLLYFPHSSGMCIYDLNKNEQFKYQNLSYNVTSSMGKVRYEHEHIIEPKIESLHFNLQGDWLVSYESQEQPQGLISSNDIQYSLKFWKLDQSNNEWVLQTKILNPHGDSVPIVEIVSHPTKKNCIVTCDNQGGLKLWSIIDEKFMRWGLIDMKLPNSNTKSSCINMCYSKDGSLLFQSFDDRLYIMDSVTFQKTNSNEGENQSFLQLDSKVQKMMLSNNDENLIICTMTSIICYNLLLGEFSTGFDVYNYLNSTSSVYKQGNMKKLMAINENNSNIAMVLNIETEGKSSSKVLIFNENLSKIMGTFDHNEYISNVTWNHDDTFVFIDYQSKIGVISSVGLQSLNINELSVGDVSASASTATTDVAANSTVSAISSNTEDEFSKNLNVLSKKVSDLRANDDKNNNNVDEEDMIDGEKTGKTLTPSSFMNLFDNIENVQLETLFDSVVKILT